MSDGVSNEPPALPRDWPGWLHAEGRAVLHWLHHPPAGRRTGWGVVVCPPVGFEHQTMYRGLRVLAERAAAQGHVVVRLDYPGTGDSAGADGGTDDWHGWLAAVRAAVGRLRADPDVGAVCVAGVQLGGLVGTVATMGTEGGAPDVDALVLVAPAPSGRGWLRERRALLATMGRPDGAAELPQGVQEAGGVLVAAATREALEGVVLAEVAGTLPPRVLVVDREDRPPADALVRAWQARGIAVTQARYPGYEGLLRDAHEAEVPEAMWQGVLAWMAALPAPGPGAVTSAPDDAEVAAQAAPAGTAIPAPLWQPVEAGIEEAPCFLDASAQLVGVVSRQRGGVAPAQVMLLLNAGANPRVGLGRLHVQLARRLAADGWTTVRLDLAGLGDSRPHAGIPDNTVYPPTAVADVATAAGFAREQLGAARVEAMGVCAGGYHALRAAVAGAPLDGITVINPLVFHWKPGTSLALPPYRAVQAVADYRRSVRSAAKWAKLLRGQVAVREVADTLVRQAGARLREGAREGGRLVGWPLREDLAQELARVAARGVAVRFLFSVGDPGEALLRRGAGRTLGRLARRGALRVAHVPDCDHSFSRAWMREALWGRLRVELAVGSRSG